MAGTPRVARRLSASLDGGPREVEALQQALRESEARYEQLLDAVTDYAYVVSFGQGDVVETRHGVGCLHVTGYPPEDFEADPYLWINIVHPEDREAVLERSAKLLTGDVPPLEHRIQHRDGSIRWVRSTIIRHVEDAKLVRYDGILRDITERRRIEKALHDNEVQLLMAQKIQEHLLPKKAPNLPGYDIAGVLYPADFAAGDYFDFLPNGGDRIDLVIGDVTGHGFSSALIMSLTQVLLRLLVEAHADIPQVLRHANSVLSRATDEYHFVTLLLGRLDAPRREFLYASAGHPPAYLLDRDGNVKQYLESTSHPLGMFSDITFPTAEVVQLELGDTLVLVTDGIEEARNKAGEYFGRERLVKAIRRHLRESAQQIAEALCRAAWKFTGQVTADDDTTVVVVRVLDE
ncbi:MAG: SpoIIE family protein phosphatase [Planctomycetaceae bacterium]|nr:SpoIIE family protein phosphatase [Planctomycetaceae bacterium]